MDKTVVNQKLALLKSTFKYKNASEYDHQNEDIKIFDSNEPFQTKKAESEYNARGRSQKHTMNNFVNQNNWIHQNEES